MVILLFRFMSNIVLCNNGYLVDYNNIKKHLLNSVKLNLLIYLI